MLRTRKQIYGLERYEICRSMHSLSYKILYDIKKKMKKEVVVSTDEGEQ